MKKNIIVYIIVAAGFIFNSCEVDAHRPLSLDSQAPQPISEPIVINEPGGATITYQLPDEDDLLYVKAEYFLSDGKKHESRTSFYKDSIKVEGFGDTNEYTISLYTVDRSENVSKPVNVVIQPKTPPYISVFESIKMQADFGGVRFTWLNKNNAPLSFSILSPDSLSGILIPIETVYSGMTNGEYNLRGFDPEKKTFGVIVRDRWNNFSDTLKAAITPMLEIQLDGSKFNRLILPGDANVEAWGARYENFYNYETLGGGLHTAAGTGWPQSFSVDLGELVTLSRIRMRPHTDYGFGQGVIRLFEIWGMADEPPADGKWDNWILLKDCSATRPSLEGGTADEDLAILEKGEDFNLPLGTPEVRYIRFVIKETWGFTGFWHLRRIYFYGQPHNK